MTDKFTPGPWVAKAVRTVIHIQGDSPVCEISLSTGHIYEDYPGQKAEYIARQKANARLIAAAPDLLDACRKAIYALKGREHDGFLRDAIARATGEQS